MGISIKLKFRPLTKQGRQGVLVFHIMHNRFSYHYITNYQIASSHWNYKKAVLSIPDKSHPFHNSVLKLSRRVRWEINALRKFANAMLEDNECITIEEILEQWKEQMPLQNFFFFMQSIINKLNDAKKTGTSYKYQSALNSFERCIGSRDLMLFEITTELIENYQQYLTGRKLSMNTISFYMRILRAVFNRAVKQNLVPQTNPFADVYTGVAETRKRAIDLKSIRKIKEVNLFGNKKLEFARDLFLFSFYCRGMAFVDMAYLSKDNISNGYLSYNRRKNKQFLLIKWERPMQEIVNKYKNTTRYLLPIIKASNESAYEQYMRMNKYVNRWLKKVGIKANIGTNLTMYVARHSWTSIAKQRNYKISTISRALGHTSERTTQIYIASLDNNAVDEANKDILNELN